MVQSPFGPPATGAGCPQGAPVPLSFLLIKERSQLLHVFSSAVDAGPRLAF